ncbi:methyltransferase, FkbM family [Salinimicrobium sediminis]|uniref:Methyltransferase, FkbM family n=2 Tax=Salinimicrobium sediminis TaxID=1343891 RepID=A0A285WZS0_9FLAO|nr:methyltransferase, FkbM family [Salinimicrobium sediminis]
MRKVAKKIFRDTKYYLWYNTFQKSLICTKRKNAGQILLFNNNFFYHHGRAFYDSYREIFQKKIYQFKPVSKNPTIIDCGANMGLSTLFFSKYYPDAMVIAFEPDSYVFPFLKKNMKSQILENVHLEEKAVWISESSLDFYTDKGLGGRLNKEYSGQKSTRVETVRLKEILTKKIDMLKLDIEGSEFDVLKDCEEKLYLVDHIFIEYHSTYNEGQHLDDILNLLKQSGFRYHLKESFSRNKPFVDHTLSCEKFDLAINIFGYRN